jgi:uncharacterized protein (DUF362 family)/Pyruvate/2-oxoacid:ferredoxin oxidoreductase delta subunit
MRQIAPEPQVAVVACTDYRGEQVRSAVTRAVDHVGGIRAFVRPGDRVLIKPNLLKASAPETAVTTHPEVIRAVIRLVRDAGGEPQLGDSPGFGDLRRVCEKTGVLDVIEQEGVRLADMDTAVRVKTRGQFHHFEVARGVHEADVVINLPKLKTHGMMTLTGAVKNLFGCIPGKRKIQWHFNTGVNRDAFARMLVELSALIRPALTVMDAVVGMEGNGPGSGDPRPIGVVMAANDPVALDAVAGAIVGAGPETLYVIRAAAVAGIGETNLERISLRGEPLEAVMVRDFRLPPQEHLEWQLPEWGRRLLKDALTTRPVIDHRSCMQCGVCEGHCPQKAIRRRGRRLAIEYRDCIRCFCCQEFCPRGAITVGKGWALRLVR